MFISGWGMIGIVAIILFLFLWVIRLLRHVKRMKRIIFRLEAIENGANHLDKTGDAEGH